MAAPPPGPGHDESSEELAVGWALHALEPEDAELFTRHLEGCARCRQVVEGHHHVMAELASAAPPADPPAGLAERLRAQVARTAQDTPGAGPACAGDSGAAGTAIGARGRARPPIRTGADTPARAPSSVDGGAGGGRRRRGRGSRRLERRARRRPRRGPQTAAAPRAGRGAAASGPRG